MTINFGANIRLNRVCAVITVIVLVLLYLYAINQTSDLEIKSSGKVSMKALLLGAVKAAELGGLEVVSVHEQSKLNIEIKSKTKEGLDEPVTLADYRSHCAMSGYLANAFPTVTVISEEKSKDCDDVVTQRTTIDPGIIEAVDNTADLNIDAEDLTIWIDPLDATKEYTENLLEYVSTMVCVAIRGDPVIGVIHMPFAPKQTYWGWIDVASPNLAGSHPRVRPKDPILIVSRSHAGKVENVSRLVFGDKVKIISAAGAGYKFVEVAAGNATAYVHMTAIKKWDVCAGVAITKSMGGLVTSLAGDANLDFGPTGSMVLDKGLLTTMRNHQWYLDKFRHIQ